MAGFPWRAMRKPNGRTYAVYDVRHSSGMLKVLMHRRVMAVPAGVQVDHHNHDGLDNQRLNLRPVNNTQNQANARSLSGTSKYKGVYWDKSRQLWRAKVVSEGVSRCLGRFELEVDAAVAYNRKALELWGEFAFLNNV